VGNYGSFSRKEYGAMGDSINVTARLEESNKRYGTRVCASGATVAQCEDIPFRPIGDIVLRGKSVPIGVFEPIEASGLDPEFVEMYRQAFAALAAGESNALVMFEALALINPDDGPVQMHLARLHRGETGVLLTNPAVIAPNDRKPAEAPQAPQAEAKVTGSALA
jgi:adenylate cyclase